MDRQRQLYGTRLTCHIIDEKGRFRFSGRKSPLNRTVQMPAQLLTIPTCIRAMFRLTDDENSPRIYKGMTTPGGGMRDDLLASGRQSDQMLRFLVEMDRKLDAVLALLQRESLVSDFPHTGRVVTLSGAQGILECGCELRSHAYLELLLLLDEFPMRIVSLVARVEERRQTMARTVSSAGVYALRFVRVDEEDRETIIRFVFSEDRKRIRQRKSDPPPEPRGGAG